MKEDYQKALKKLTLFLLLNSVPFNGQSYEKQNGSRTSDQSLFRSQKKFRKTPLFVIHYLTKFEAAFELFQAVKQFLSYSKNYMTS